MGDNRWFNMHTHSHHSTVDGMSPVTDLVAHAVRLGYPALGLSDHGNMGGITRHYIECRKNGILPYPGFEGYLVDPDYDGTMEDKAFGKAGRFHFGLYARTERGYKGLVKIMRLSHTRPRFNRFSRVTLDDLADFGQEFGEDVILTTGCYFGWLQQNLVHKGEDYAEMALTQYANLFPHTFVEVQHHNIDHSKDDGDAVSQWTDDSIVAALSQMADDHGLPLIATQDSHYTLQRQKIAHNMMKTMVYAGADDSFPGDSFHLASGQWVEDHYDASIWEQAMEGNAALLELNKVRISPLDNYKPRIPVIAPNAFDRLKKLCVDALRIYLNKKGLLSKKQVYLDRLKEELTIIRDLGFADYFLHWVWIVAQCRAKGVCIEARGSANSSLVAFLIEVTQVDSVRYNLRFSRFVARDRKKPPDIDMDIEDEHRDWLVHLINNKWPSIRIGSWSELGAREEDGKGSVIVSYRSYLVRKAEKENRPDLKQKIYAAIQTTDDVDRYFPDDYEPLMELAGTKVYRSYGQHAAGVLLGTDEVPLDQYIPTMLVASSNSSVCQYDMDDVEEWGLLKDDILGQKTLAIMKRCQELVGRNNPNDFTWIPEDDPKACKALSEGRVDTGIFHFENPTKARGGREMKIKSTADVILAVALYMPGAMNSGQKDLYIKLRREPGLRKDVRYLHKAYEDALSETFSAVVYQDQVIDIMRGLGMDDVGVNAFFKIVKDSGAGSAQRNAVRMMEVRKNFNQLCKTNGITDVAEAWRLTAGMAAYGFNKGHATGYGIRAYRAAYLKTHYPLEYMAAVLEKNSGNEKKERVYVRETRRLGMLVFPPDVNISTTSWTLDREQSAIRRGLLSVHGVGKAAAQELERNAPFTSVDDIIRKCSPRAVSGGKELLKTGKYTGVLGALYQAGALNRLLDKDERKS